MKNKKVNQPKKEKPIPPKLIKYLANRSQGKNKTESAIEAGYSPSTANVAGTAIEGTQIFKTASEAFATSLAESLLSLTGKLPMKSLSDGLAETTIQSDDKGAKLKAIQMSLEHFGARAPEHGQSGERILITLSGYSKEQGGDDRGSKIFNLPE